MDSTKTQIREEILRLELMRGSRLYADKRAFDQANKRHHLWPIDMRIAIRPNLSHEAAYGLYSSPDFGWTRYFPRPKR